MKNQITNGFDKMPLGNLLVKAKFIISEMTVNAAYFPTPDPALPAVQASVDELELAIMAAENRDRSAIAYRNERRDDVVKLLRKLGIYVNLMADGNRAIAMASGFDVAKDPQPKPPITFVEAPVLSLGANFGELKSKVKSVVGARTYEFLITPNDQLPLSQWTRCTTSQTNYYFKNLESGKRYYVRVGVIGIKDQLVYSDTASYVTQ